LTIARFNLYQLGKEQLRTALGHLGDNNSEWEAHYKWPFSLNNLKKAARLEENEVHLGRMYPELIHLFTSLFRDVSELVPSDELYQIFTLISMLDTTGMNESEGISEMLKLRQVRILDIYIFCQSRIELFSCVYQMILLGSFQFAFMPESGTIKIVAAGANSSRTICHRKYL